MGPIRWSDHDRYFGPFTYARDRPDYRPFALELASGDDDDYPGCRIMVRGFGHTLLLALPAFILRPAREWHEVSNGPYREKLIAEGRSTGYWETWNRVFGFQIIEGALHLHYGAQTHDSRTDRSKCYFLPWRSWRHVRRSFYGVYGQHLATLPERRLKGLTLDARTAIFDAEREVEERTPRVVFCFADYDGEELRAATHIEEREWRRGEGWFRWLSWFSRPRIERSLCIEFSGETGKRKGSWKGGTIGHAIAMKPGERHEAAFRRYCLENDMTYIEDCGRSPVLRAGHDFNGPDGQGYRLKNDVFSFQAIRAEDFEALGGAPEPAGGVEMPDWLARQISRFARF